MKSHRFASTSKRSAYLICQTVAWCSSLFLMLVIALLVINYFNLKKAAPLETDTMHPLIKLVQQQPENQDLKVQIRVLDQLNRQAYFRSVMFNKNSIYLLVGGFITLLLSLHIMNYLLAPNPDPKSATILEPGEGLLIVKQYIIGAAITLVAIAFILNTMSNRILSDDYKVAESAEIPLEKLPSRQEWLNNWANFRGPDGAGVAASSCKPPMDWDIKTGKNILWESKIELPGFSSPIIWDDKIFLSGANKKIEAIFCYSLATGKQLWKGEVRTVIGAPATPPEVTEDTGYAAATCVTDGKRVFAIFATGTIVAFDFAGKQLWARNLGVPENHYGHSSSLLIYKRNLLVQYDHGKASKLLALNITTGKTNWSKQRNADISWASPLLIPTADSAIIVLNAGPKVITYNAETGDEIWAVECMGGEVGPSPTFANGKVFVTNQYACTAAINLKDGTLNWQNEDLDFPDVASPLAVDDLLYLASDIMLYCLEQSCGSLAWEQEFEEGFYSSPILVDGKIFLLDKKGVMHILKPGNKFHEIKRLKVASSAVCTPVFKDELMIIRVGKKLLAIGKLKEK